MSYIGQTLPADTFQGFTTDSFAGDGSATTFTLSKTPFNESALLVVINNVVQKPTTNFTVSGTTLTIVGTAVADGDVIYATHIGGALPIGQAASLDLNGASDQLILDADADTTISADTDDQIDFKAGGTDRMHIVSGHLSVGASSITNGGGYNKVIQVSGTEGCFSALSGSNEGLFAQNGVNTQVINRANGYMQFRTNNVERMNIASDGDVLLGAGNIDSSSNDLIIYSTASGHAGLRMAAGYVGPTDNAGSSNDGAWAFGASAYRWATFYATTGTINTSDKNEKQDIEELTDAEKRVAVAAKGLLRKYKWKDAVEEKSDKARTHFGIIAQDLEDAFTAEGLDASNYGMFCSDTWWEKENEEHKYEETEGYTKKTRLGVRYDQVLAFIIGGI
jgi:hypothetical protein